MTVERVCRVMWFALGWANGVREHGAEVWEMLHGQDGSLYVCGATTMGKEVDAAIIDIAMEHGGGSGLVVGWFAGSCEGCAVVFLLDAAVHLESWVGSAVFHAWLCVAW